MGWHCRRVLWMQALANCHTPLYKGKRQILARAKVGTVPLLLGFSRRTFLKSLSRTATVLSLESIFGLVRAGRAEPPPTGWLQGAAPAAPATVAAPNSQIAGTPLG